MATGAAPAFMHSSDVYKNSEVFPATSVLECVLKKKKKKKAKHATLVTSKEGLLVIYLDFLHQPCQWITQMCLLATSLSSPLQAFGVD